MRTRDVKSILRSVRKRLSDPNKWTRQCSSRDSLGKWVNVTSPTASSWCLVGAISVETFNTRINERKAVHVSDFLVKFQPSGYAGCSLAEINDDYDFTHKKLMNWLDRAINS